MRHVPLSIQNMLLNPLLVRTEINLSCVKLHFMRKSVPNYRRDIRNNIIVRERACKIFYMNFSNSVKRSFLHANMRIFRGTFYKLILLHNRRS